MKPIQELLGPKHILITKTYYFYVRSYVQAISEYDGVLSTGKMFSIDVPSGGAIPWVKVNG